MPSYYPPGFRTADGVPLDIPADAAGALTGDGAGGLSWVPGGGVAIGDSPTWTGTHIFENHISAPTMNAGTKLQFNGGDSLRWYASAGQLRCYGYSADVITVTNNRLYCGSTNGTLDLNPPAINAPRLPTSDPLIAGRLWNDSGTLKVSAG